MRILAFDPGFERLGAAVVEKNNGPEVLIHSECVRTSAKNSFPIRLQQIGAAAEALIEQYTPDAVALEEIFFGKNEKTGVQIAEVRGVLTYIAMSRGLTVYDYTPLEVKIAITGYGKSDKKAVAAMVPRLVRLPSRKDNKQRLDDEMDAIAVGLTCLASVRLPR
jgi:crossover junction endodeoxyribonuclease RuvC